MKMFRKEKVEGKCLSSKWLNINECVAGTNLAEIINTGKTPV
jgi:HKD family nuclease